MRRRIIVLLAVLAAVWVVVLWLQQDTGLVSRSNFARLYLGMSIDEVSLIVQAPTKIGAVFSNGEQCGTHLAWESGDGKKTIELVIDVNERVVWGTFKSDTPLDNFLRNLGINMQPQINAAPAG